MHVRASSTCSESATGSGMGSRKQVQSLVCDVTSLAKCREGGVVGDVPHSGVGGSRCKVLKAVQGIVRGGGRRRQGHACTVARGTSGGRYVHGRSRGIRGG